jgi:endonuclease/exonuclease/phosphatase family metal-dependent hydrolase
MKKAIVACILIAIAAVLGSSINGEHKCEQLPLLVGEPPRQPGKGGPEVIIVSLNMYEETNVEKILKEIRAADPLRKADIFLLQEVVQRPSVELSMARKVAQALNFYYAFAPVAPRQEDAERGIAILSRYELKDPMMIPLRAYNLVFRSRCRVALAVTVETALGDVRVVNVHLDNRLNSREKVDQLAPVLEAMSQHRGPRIIGGDFNTGDFLWVTHVLPLPYAQRQSSAIVEALSSRGFSTPFRDTGATFDHFGLRLDWIFLKELKSLANGIVPIQFSDHHAIWVRLGRGSEPKKSAALQGRP